MTNENQTDQMYKKLQALEDDQKARFCHFLWGFYVDSETSATSLEMLGKVLDRNAKR